nr:hypothetical protein 11 [Saccharospirillaceae bacterium]
MPKCLSHLLRTTEPLAKPGTRSTFEDRFYYSESSYASHIWNDKNLVHSGITKGGTTSFPNAAGTPKVQAPILFINEHLLAKRNTSI